MITVGDPSNAKKAGTFFAPVPCRAFGMELLPLELRVLGVIGMHARFGANELGCTIGGAGIAHKVAADEKSVIKAITRLRTLGLVRQEPHPRDKRKRMLFLEFDPVLDLQFLREVPQRNRCRTEHPSPAVADDRCRTEHQNAPQVIESEGGSTEYITSLKVEDTGLKTLEDTPLKEGAFENAPSSQGQEVNPYGRLKAIERAWRTGQSSTKSLAKLTALRADSEALDHDEAAMMESELWRVRDAIYTKAGIEPPDDW